MAAINTISTPNKKKRESVETSRIARMDSAALVMLLPALLLVLVFSIFPLITSVYLSLSRIAVSPELKITYIGVENFRRQLLGSNQTYFLGRFGEITPVGYAILGAMLAFLLYMLMQFIRRVREQKGGVTTIGLVRGVFFRLITITLLMFFTWQFVTAFSPNGRPGTLTVTLIFVFGGVTLQYLIGLGLAMLLTQNLKGRRFFRVAFLLPMMVTPVGVGFLFRMLVDTVQGPIAPVWTAVGLQNFSWAQDPNLVRLVIILSDTWQWTPFMFIILLAALEGVSKEVMEAALVDGATRWQFFSNIILPEIIPVSTTLILIRTIEAFKLVDLPNSLLGGGPGTASESITLQAYKSFRAPNLGESSALAYLLLFVVTFFALVYVNHIRSRLLERT
jgi:multiple sugar transport system permease protein